MDFSYLDPKTIYTILHLLGVALGAGGAYVSDVIFLSAIKDRKIDETEGRMIKLGSTVTWVGLLLLIVSGVLLVTTDVAGYLASSKFQLKMLIVGVLTINGIIFHWRHIPLLEYLGGKQLRMSKKYIERSNSMYMSGAISVVSWTAAIVLGALRGLPVSFVAGVVIYLLVCGFAILVALKKRQQFFAK